MSNWFQTHPNRFVNLDRADGVLFSGPDSAVVIFPDGDITIYENEKKVDELYARLDSMAHPAKGK